MLTDTVLARVNKTAPQKLVNDLMTACYTEAFMAAHSLGGISSKDSKKSSLPHADILQIIGVFCL